MDPMVKELKEPESLKETMLRDHKTISNLLKRFENESAKDWCGSKPAFVDLKLTLERHFITEERAIFFYLDKGNPEIFKMMERLVKEHNVLNKELKELEGLFMPGPHTDTTRFVKLLVAHRDFEDEMFYPRLDRDLSAEKKRSMIETLKGPL